MASETIPHDAPLIRIRAGSNRPPIDLGEIVRYRELLWTLADRDIRVRYKQTALGVIWVILQPLVGSFIFAFIFGVMARLKVDGVPYVVFSFASLTAWNLFSGTVSRVCYSLLSNSAMVSKIYFPRLILPISSTAATLIDFGVSLGMMAVMLFCYRINPGWGLLLLPIWIVLLMLLAVGLGLATGAMTVKYRDINIIMPITLQMLMYISPVAWSTTNVPEKYRWVFLVNPMSGLLDAIRWSLLGVGSVSPGQLLYSTVVSLAVFWAGATVFKQQERSFADVI